MGSLKAKRAFWLGFIRVYSCPFVVELQGSGQDRLVKALRLAKINDLESANRFLDETYLKEFNRRFARPAASWLRD